MNNWDILQGFIGTEASVGPEDDSEWYEDCWKGSYHPSRLCYVASEEPEATEEATEQQHRAWQAQGSE